MKGGNTDSKTSDVQGFDYDGVEQYGTVNMTGGKWKGKGKSKSKSKSKPSKFSEFDFEKEWKEFEESYNQKYGGASKKKKTSSSTKKKPVKKASSTKKPVKKPKRKTQRGGDEASATFAPAQFFDANASMSAPSSDKSTGSLVDGLFPHSPNNPVVAQTGGSKKKKVSKAKTATKTTKPKKDSKKKEAKKDSKKDTKKDSKKDSKKDTKSTGKKTSVLDKIKKFFAM